VSSSVRIYGNRDVLRVVGLIPKSHTYMGLVLVLRDRVIVLQEAAVAAVV
jgi:hypothetical protein